MSYRLALVVPSVRSAGGVAAVARFLLQAARKSGRYEVQVVSLATSSDDECSTFIASPWTWPLEPTSSAFKWEGTSCIHFGARCAELEFQRIRSRKPLRTYLSQFDLIQVVAGSPAWANCAIGAGPPVSLQVATLAKVERRSARASIREPLTVWRHAMTHVTSVLDKRAIMRVDAVQVENAWMLDYARTRNGARENVDIRYSPPGVDEFKYVPRDDRLMQDDPYVLCVGRLDHPRKKADILLEAFAQVAKSLPGIRLITAGAGKPLDQYWQSVRDFGLSNRITHISSPSEEALIALYQGAAAFALASDEEGLGVVVLEAMACGVPVVSTRSGGPDGIITDGVDGFLVPRGDASAMARRLEQLLRDRELNRTMGIASRVTVERRFSLEGTGRIFIDVWDKLVALPRVPSNVD